MVVHAVSLSLDADVTRQFSGYGDGAHNAGYESHARQRFCEVLINPK
jgi:hypothetical protein